MLLHSTAPLPVGGSYPIDREGGGMSPQLAQLVLEVVKLGFTAVVLVVLALILA